MSSPSTKPAVKALLSQIALIADALNDCKSMGLGGIASITETVGGEDTYADASLTPRSHPMIVWMMCTINVWSVKKELIRGSVTLYMFVRGVCPEPTLYPIIASLAIKVSPPFGIPETDVHRP